MQHDLNILIADDHPFLRQGLRQFIESAPRFHVVAEAIDGHAALSQIQQLAPDIAILDLHMPGLSGLEVSRALHAQTVPTAVIILTMYKDEEMFNAALDAGVKGYVLKDSAMTELLDAIRAAASGQPYVSPALTQFLLKRAQRATALVETKPGLEQLTQTERRVLKLIADYKTSKEIAAELHVHPRTVDTHRTNICQKLDLHGTHSLLKFALAHKSELG